MTDGREDSEDILRFLASNVESIHDKVGGSRTVRRIETRIGRVEDHMATKEELAAVRERMATKEDVTAIRGDIERVRFTDRQYRPHPFHAHGSSGQRVSRLRSAVYLLAKDRPEILRILGENEEKTFDLSSVTVSVQVPLGR